MISNMIHPETLERIRHEAVSFAEENGIKEPLDLDRYSRLINEVTKGKIEQHLDTLNYWVTNLNTTIRRPKNMSIFFFKDLYAEYQVYLKEVQPLEQRKALPQRTETEMYFKRSAEEAFRDTYLYLWMDFGKYKGGDENKPINPTLFERFSDQLVSRNMILANEFSPDEIELGSDWSKFYCEEHDSRQKGLLTKYVADLMKPPTRDHIKIGLVYMHFNKRWKNGERPHETLKENIDCYEADLQK